VEAGLESISAPDLASPGFKANPYPFYAQLRAQAPVFRTRAAFGLTAWLVTRYDDVVRVLKDERFANDWSRQMPLGLRRMEALTRHMLNSDPPDHTRLRTLVQKAFTPRMVERLRDRVHSVCAGLLDAAALHDRMDAVGNYALQVPLTVIGELLGIPVEDRLRFHSWSRSGISATSRLHVLRAIPNLWLFFRHLRKLIAARRAKPRDDLISALVQAEEAGDRLNEEELQAMCILLLIAGYETTVNLISSGTLALIQNRAQYELFRQNEGLGESAVEELLRYTSPIDIASFRVAREDTVLEGVAIRRGEMVLAALGSANHDETQFVNPEMLDLTRATNKHAALGQGAHFCLGAPLARMEGQIALTALWKRFPYLRLAQPAAELRWRRNLMLRGLEELPVIL
jgi:cytochrome P450 PksS